MFTVKWHDDYGNHYSETHADELVARQLVRDIVTYANLTLDSFGPA